MKYADLIVYLCELRAKLMRFLKRILALFCDEDFDLDVFRIIGIASYSSAIAIALKSVSVASSIDATKLGILAALVTALSGIGAKMFDIAGKGDFDRLTQRKVQ